MNFLHFLKLVITIGVFVFPKLLIAQGLDSRVGDEQFLQDFANSTSIGWTTFDLSTPPTGVTVATVDGELRIKEVDVAFLDITGTIPASIGNLTKMTHWKSKNNYLTGEIPETIGNLTSLVWLSLASGSENDIRLDKTYYNHPSKVFVENNKFSGGLPDVFHNLQNLQLIEARNAELSGPLPPSIGQAHNLKGVFLDSNNFTGTLPPSWGNLSKLHHMGLRHNQLEGEVPIEWENGLVEISFIWLTGNSFSGMIPDFQTDGLLLFYGSKGNIWSGSFPSWFFDGRHKNLHTFNVGAGDWTGGLPDTIGGVDGWTYPHLTTFAVQGVNGGLTGPLPDWVKGLQLVQLQLQGNSLSGELPGGMLDALDRLRLFIITDNNFEGPLPSGNWAETIFYIHFQNNNFTGGIPASWESLLNTTRDLQIDLSGNNIEGLIPEFFKDVGINGGGSLSFLRLHNNKLTPKDILPHRDAINAVKTHATYQNVYLPQKPFGTGQTLATGSVIDLSAFDYTGNQYQWLKDGNLISGVNSYTIDTSEYGPGNYKLEIRHPDIDYTFESEIIRVSEDGDSALESPDLVSPSANATNVSVTPNFEWNSVSADSYTLRVYNSSGSLIFENTGSGISYTTPTSRTLDYNTEYSWRVRATRDGITSDWSASQSFKTTSSDDGGNGNNGKGPQKATPAMDEKKVSKKTTFKWGSVQDAESYTIEVREASTLSLAVEEQVSDTVFVSPQELKGNTGYVWRVRATVQGQPGEWSDEWEFTTTDEEMVFEVELNQNYPNPFNPSTNIRFNLSEQQEVSLKVYDMAGRLVATLINSEVLGNGTHSAQFNANNLASGIYFYRLITLDEIVTRKMTLMK